MDAAKRFPYNEMGGLGVRMLPLPRLVRRSSFKSKLFLSYMLIVLIPVSISAVWIYDQVIAPLRGERLQLIEQAMNQLQSAVDKETDDIEKTGYLMSTNIVLKKSLLKRYYDESEIIEVMNTSIQSLLSWFEATNKDIGVFHFFTDNETLPESNFFIPIPLVSGQSWFERMTAGIRSVYPYWEGMHAQRPYPYGRKDGKPVYSMFYPINEDFPDDTSYLELEIDIRHFFARLDGLTLSKSGFALAIGWDGNIVYAPGQASEIAQGIADLPALRDRDLSSPGSGELVYKGSAYRFVVKPLERLQTSFVGLIPVREIDGPWNDTRNIFMLLIAFLTVLLAVLSFLLAGLLIKKIVRIVGGVRKIQNGNFQARIPVKGNDEIDWLAVSINSMAGQIDELVNRVYKSQVSQKEAELNALQAQINPHFLFNTLETLRMMAEVRDERQLSDALTALGSIMRYNIAGGKQSATLATEIEHIQDYVQIQNLLHNNRIEFRSAILEPLLACRIPNLLLQPLVENCIVHGMKNHNGSLNIVIEVEETDTSFGRALRCSVKDDGSGIAPARLEHIVKRLSLDPEQRMPAPSERNAPRSGGVGLTNVHDRILFAYGQTDAMRIESEPGRGTVVTITLPAQTT